MAKADWTEKFFIFLDFSAFWPDIICCTLYIQSEVLNNNREESENFSMNVTLWYVCFEFNIKDGVWILLDLLLQFPLIVLHLQIREGRITKLSECLKKEFRLTINILRSTISGDIYEVII